MNRFLRPCSRPGCPKLTYSAYCDEHKSSRDRNRPSAWKRGYNYKWQKYRERFLSQHPLCEECGKLATVVDHIVPHKGNQTLFWDSNNHQSLCETCHNRKTALYDMGAWETDTP